MSRHHSWPIMPDGRQIRIGTGGVVEVYDTNLTTLLHQTSTTGGRLYSFLKTAAGVVNTEITDDVTANRLTVGDVVVTGSYYQGLTVGGNVYEVVAGGTGTEDGGLYVNAGTLQLHGMVAEAATQWGAKADGTTDDTARIQAAINGIPLNSTLLLPDGSRCITTLTVARKIKLRGGRLSWTAGITNAEAVLVTADGVELHGVTLINPSELGAATGNRNVGVRFTANEGAVVGCTVQQFQNGIMVSAEGEYGRFRIADNRVIDIVGVGGGPASASTDGEDRGDGIVVWGAQASITGNVVSAKSGTDARIGIHCEGLPGSAVTPGTYFSAQYTISDNIVYGQFRRGISVEDVSEAAVTGNTVADSTWWAVSLAANCRASHLTGNTILWTRAGTDNQGSAFSPQRGPIMAYGITHDSVIAGNTIRIAGTAAAAIIVQGVDSSNRGTDTLVTNNTWYVESGALTDGIKADNTTRLRLAGNKGSGHTALGVNAFVADSIEIVGNHLRGGAGATFGIQTSGVCTAALVDSNILETVGTGINLNNHTGRVVVTDNDLRTITTTGVDLFGCSTGKVWGNTTGGAATGYANITGAIQRDPYITSGAGTPEAAITAPVGSTYHRTDGAAATTLYVKETGAGNTGWVAVGTSAATTTSSGIVELADNTETQTGTDAARAVTPAGLASLTSSDTRAGLVELATVAEVATGTDTARAVTPAGVAGRIILTWTTGTAYTIGTLVNSGDRLYRCTTAHTASAAFATDVANWTEVSNGATGASGLIQYAGPTGLLTSEAALTYDAALDQLTVPGLTVTQDLLYTGVTTAAIAADTNDAAPTNLATTTIIELTGTRPYLALTGLVAQPAGSTKQLVNIGTVPIILRGDSAASAAANRFAWAFDKVIDPAETVTVYYSGTTSRWHPTHAITPDPNLPSTGWSFVEDFISASTETGEVGVIGASFTNGSVATLAPVTGNPGILSRVSSATANQVASMSPQTSGATTTMKMSEWSQMIFRGALATTGADFIVRWGFGDNATSNPPANFIGIERVAADLSFFAVCRSGGVQTRSAALIAQDTNYHSFSIRQISATSIGFQVDRGVEVVISTNVPAGTINLTPMHTIIPTAAAARTHNIDFWSARGTYISARW